MDYTVEVLKKCKEYGFKVRRRSSAYLASTMSSDDARHFTGLRADSELTSLRSSPPLFATSRSSWILIRTSYVLEAGCLHKVRSLG